MENTRMESLQTEFRFQDKMGSTEHVISTFTGLLNRYDRKPKPVAEWGLAVKYDIGTILNGLGDRITKKLENPDICELVQQLTVYRLHNIEADLGNLTPFERTLSMSGFCLLLIMDWKPKKKHLSVLQANFVLLKCLEELYPRHVNALCKMRHSNSEPVKFLEEGLQCVSPKQLSIRSSHNKSGPSEHVFHAELYTAFQDLAPEGWCCASEAHLSQGDSSICVDLLIYKSEQRHWGYELKVGKATEKDIKGPVDQALCYAMSYGVDFYLVNLVSKLSAKPQSTITWSLPGMEQKVYVVNIEYNDTLDFFEDTCLEQPLTARVMADGVPKEQQTIHPGLGFGGIRRRTPMELELDIPKAKKVKREMKP